MSENPTSRRQFVMLTTGFALALRHGLLPAQPAGAVGAAGNRDSAARIEDPLLRIEWDSNLHSRVWHREDGRWVAVSEAGPSEYLLLHDGRHLADFALSHQSRRDLDDRNGPGTQLSMTGTCEHIEKTVVVTTYQRHPGLALVRAAYRNTGAAACRYRSWTSADTRLPAPDAQVPAFWCYSGATYENRRDWVRPVTKGFAQDNFLGMVASDYGGGTPIVDVWGRRGGVAVGHVESTPRRVSLPVAEENGNARIAVCGRESGTIAPGGQFTTPETFVAIHDGDYFATLTRYRGLMSERGLTPAAVPATSYEPIWCAWGYERSCTTALIEGTLPKVKELGLSWAVIDDGWQKAIGDWTPDHTKYPNGDADMRKLVSTIRTAGLKPRLWYSPLSVAPGSDFLHDHADMLLLDKDGAIQKISWWNSFYLCPAYAPTVLRTQELVRTFIGTWGFAGLKIDGQHLNNVAPCYNPAHNHAHPDDSVAGLQDFFRAIYETAIAISPQTVVELCPCGTAYSAFNFPAMNQAPGSDPESSWQVRHKGKTLKGLMGPSAPYAGDHVELSDRQDDFASTVGVGAVVSTKFTWPVDPKPKDSFLLTPAKEQLWRRWVTVYRDKMLPTGIYRGELYDIGFDRPEAHAIEKSGRMHYAFFADRWRGTITLRGLRPGTYRIRDYVNDRDLGTVAHTHPDLNVTFEHHLLLEAIPT